MQDTEATIDIIDTIYRARHGTDPLRLREDFCGTAKLCADWVSSHSKRLAVGLDNNVPTLDWAAKHNIAPLGNDARRVELIEQDVLEGTSRRFDVVAAFNFSYWVFHERAAMRRYFQSVRSSLKPGGVFVLDIHGGPDSQYALEEATEQDGFTYVWDQDSFDPITNRTKCYIHFQFPDGSEIRKAFEYDWRVWSLPELRDLLYEAGYKNVVVWWDGEDDVLRPADSAENLISWIAYIAAWR